MAPETDLSRRFELGPYLLGAFICEEVLEEKNGNLSFIRVIDRITRTAQGRDAPEQMAPFVYNFNIVVLLKSGDNPGNFRVGVQPIKPDNERLPPLSFTVNLVPPQDQGSCVIGKTNFPFDLPGLWWFDVTLNDVRVTRIPVRVIYLPQPMMGPM